MTPQRFYTPDELAVMFAVDKSTIYKWVRAGDLECIRRSRFTRVSETALQRFVDGLTVPARKARR
jgi:excisionase family DNA binding protein